MSLADERPPRDDASLPATEGNDPPRKDRPVERRSPTRPQFVEGWRKDVQRKVHEANEAPALELAPTAHIDIWMASPDALMKAELALTLLSDEDWETINGINDPANTAQRHHRARAAAHRPVAGVASTRSSRRPGVSASIRKGGARWPRGCHASTSASRIIDPLVLVAISPTLEVGVDVECIDQDVSPDVIAEFSHLDEHHSVGGLPRPREIREFIRLWTLKEAYTKMVGTGHSLDFKSIKFTLDPVRLETVGGKIHDGASGTTQFENFYISNKHLLFHASLAVRHPPGDMGITEVQIISLADIGGAPSNTPMPMVR